MSGDTVGYTPLQVSMGYGTHDIYLEQEKYRDHYLSYDITDSRVISETVKMRETPEVIARRTYKQRMFKSARGGAISGVLAGVGYVGYKKLNTLEEEAGEEDDNKGTYQAGKYVALGVSTLDSTKIMIELDFIEARLELRSIPAGALVVVSGDTVGYTPLQVSMGYGTHDIYLEQEKYRDHYLSYDITDSRVISETVKMRETPEVIARRTYKQRMFKSARGGAISGVLAGVGYSPPCRCARYRRVRWSS